MKIKLDDSWKKHLNHHINSEGFKNLVSFVKSEYQNHICYPKGSLIFSSLNNCKFENVKLVILGQDPYHGLGQANGLSFSVNEGITIPPSLLNIFKELNSDLNIPISKTGNLQLWAEQGVLLLNSILTVEKDNANSHKDIGWEIFTKKVIEVISTKLNNIVFILWGKQANCINDIIDSSKHHIISSVHPSPLSAHRGFFGSKPFSKTNEFLKSKGISPIDWNLN